MWYVNPKTTLLLVLLNTATYIGVIAYYGLGPDFGPSPQAIRGLALHPYFVLHRGEWWRLVTSLFLHMDPLHLFFNMYALYIAGRIVEAYYGPIRTLTVYFTSGIAGNLASLILPVFSAGASGAVFGLFGAVVVVEKRITGTAAAVLAFLVLVLVLSNLAYPGQINNIAHIVGVIVGYLTAKAMTSKHKRTLIIA